MKIVSKEQKIRDRIIFMFNVIPQEVDVDRHIVHVSLRQKDVDRMHLDIEEVRDNIEKLVDRKVEIQIV